MEFPSNATIAVIGLGYVGLPLALAFSRLRRVIGFDVNSRRIAQLRDGHDSTGEVGRDDLKSCALIDFQSDESVLAQAKIFIITVPTPIDVNHRPDLAPLLSASRLVAKYLKKGDVVIYESTVYPGATEEDCVPVLEHTSGLTLNKDFFCGYSPERINPGDKNRKLEDIIKVTSGSNLECAKFVDELYASIVVAGTYQAPSIRVAEAAKVIENTQRDLNIALINELSIIFERLGLDTDEVLRAASTKWNFLPFKPGLVGGHCIGVDPYYLTHKAEQVGYHPEVILAGRRINDSMASHVATTVVKLMLKKQISVLDSNVLMLWLSFKENCSDLRNSKVFDLIKALQSFQINVAVYDPLIDRAEASKEYGICCLPEAPSGDQFDAIVLAVPHNQFLASGSRWIRSITKPGGVIFDVKSVLAKSEADGRL